MEHIIEQLSRYGLRGRIKTLQRRFHQTHMENGAVIVGRMEHWDELSNCNLAFDRAGSLLRAECCLRAGSKPPAVCYWNVFGANGIVGKSYSYNSRAGVFNETVYVYDAQQRLIESRYYELNLTFIAENHSGGLEAALSVKKADNIAAWTINADGSLADKQGNALQIDFASLARSYQGDYLITAYRYDDQSRCIEETEHTPWRACATRRRYGDAGALLEEAVYTADAPEFGAEIPPLPELPDELFRYRYDAEGRETECLHSTDGETVLLRSAEYDGEGRLNKVFEQGRLEREFSYHADGSVSEMVIYDDETGDERRRFVYASTGLPAAQTFLQNGCREPNVDYPDYADACYFWDASAQDWIEEQEEDGNDGMPQHEDECVYDDVGNLIERRTFDSEGELAFIEYQTFEYY